ncbi:O-antigen polymerase [Pseudarthrobacter sp. C4D7]|uniref:O-antigen polymerase n=1 Tax=Pseudarthrobacter sp. C4D7 TaxID=2735268 RepID=UPI001584B513|nr:O-antigen polymerase [Pseudarthrobacter sp. C4D7]NUT71230.1 oligosaccharide repeat unit polymerase [Pseudarthrobacter sp. C4D7]
MIFAFILISASLVAIANFLKMPFVNPITALVFPWLTVMVLASIPGAIEPRLSSELWAIVLAGFSSIAVGSITGWLVLGEKPRTRLQNAKPIQLNRLAFVHKILSFVLGIYGVLQAVDAWPVLQSLGGVKAIFSASSGLGNEYKYQYSQVRLETTSSALDSASFLSSSLGYVLFLGHISLFTGAILWRSGKRFIASLPLIFAGAYSLFSLQRTSFFMCFLIFVVSYIFSKNMVTTSSYRSSQEFSRKNRGKVMTAIIGGLVVIPVLLYPIQQRNNTSHNSTGLESLAQYLLSSVAGLNARIFSDSSIAVPPAEITGQVAPSPGYGSYTFTGLYTILNRLRLPVPVAPHSLDYYSVDIFGIPFTTNTGTSFLDFFLDFGWAGLILMSFLLGFFAALSLRLYSLGAVSALPILAMLIVSIFWSFFVNALMGDFRYTYMALCAAVFFRWIIYGNAESRAARAIHAGPVR